MDIAGPVLVSLSLCADCFAVSLCSGVTLGKARWADILRVALVFAFIQAGFLFAGWVFGNLLSGLVHKISHVLGFLLLLYVGGSMLWEGIKGEEDVRDLKGFRNMVIGGVATSIDALAVGAARSIDGQPVRDSLPYVACLSVITALSVVAGIWGGRKIGAVYGRAAEIVGGLVLVGIGISILI